MELPGDDRGQAIQVGAVLLFAMLIIAMSVYQAQVVPRENAEIEFESYLDASTDMTQLRNDLLGVAATDTQRGTTVTTGTTYPARVFFVNPGTATGRIRTGEPANLSFSNVKSTSEKRNVDRYLQSESATLEYSTRDVVFEPSYNEISDRIAPIVVANGFTYRNYSSPVAMTSQTIIQGNRLTFVTVDGDFEAGGVTTPLTTEPVSAHTRTVTVTNRTTDPLVLTVPTPINASTWEDEIIAGQLDPAGTNPDRYVTSVDPGPEPNTVNITLETGESYELRLGRVELHEKSDASEVADPEARYLTAVTDTKTTTNRNGRVKLVVEARDRFNNPASNTNVTFNQSKDRGTFETAEGNEITFPIKTDENGQSTVYYNATGNLGTIPVDAWLGTTDPPEDEKDVRFSVFNSVVDGSGGGGSGEQAGRSLVVLNSHDGFSDSSDDDIVITLNNTGSFQVNVTGYRLDYVTAIDADGGLRDGAQAITSIELNGTTKTGDAYEGKSPYFFGGDTIPISGGLHDLTVTFDSGVADGAGPNPQAVMLSFSIYLEGDLTTTLTLHVILPGGGGGGGGGLPGNP